jgi:hypothetical protein
MEGTADEGFYQTPDPVYDLTRDASFYGILRLR